VNESLAVHVNIIISMGAPRAPYMRLPASQASFAGGIFRLKSEGWHISSKV